MSEKSKENRLGVLLTSLLKSRSLSMRKLSALTGIDTATISRIVSGKQRAKPDHLETFALHLQVPAAHLFQAAGFDIRFPPPARESEIFSSINHISDVLRASNLIEHEFTAELVERELRKYEKYALTEEGKQIILEDFPIKVASVNGAGPFIDELNQMYLSYCEDKISVKKRAILGSALLYFVLSADIIPDYVFPIGYLDDAIAVRLVLERLNQADGS